ncbi:MAG: sugar ABC transporter ATP-binding protein [Myxococcales bacterium]|nr:sugar ABC transporter ATP-binding protein [Myxococcales bacterium]
MLVVRGVEKHFGPTHALTGVELTVAAGEVHAVLGENGAGKSTLMNVLCGAFPADAGTVTLGGARYAPADPDAAFRAGVAIVHQELSLCPHLTVEENLLLGDESTRAGFLDRRRLRERAAAALARVGSTTPLDARALDLSPAAQQLVEIARALVRGEPRLLILDEPTSSLGADDAERLFALIGELSRAGIAILYVSHFLEEVKRVAQRFTVLRDGATVGTGAVADTSIDAMVTQMAGRRVEELFPRSEHPRGEPLLVVEALSGSDKPLAASLVVHRGEVLGIAGLVGAGRTELLRAVFGLDRVVSGEVRVGAWRGPRSPRDALDHGLGLLSEDRKGEGLAQGLSLAENLALSRLPSFVRAASLRATAQRWVERLGIRAGSVDAPVSELSGGNQQKVALARLLHHDVDVLLLDEPTRGIDVRSKAAIYAEIDALARAGKAIVLVSSFLPELLGVCDRVAVMCRGRLGEARPIAEWTEHAILKEAVGA